MGVGLKPATKFLNNSLGEQLEHIESELQEIKDAIYDWANSLWLYFPDVEAIERARQHVFEEIVDLQMSCETMLAMFGLTAEERDEIRRRVIEKNEKRGYFEDGDVTKIAGVGPDAPVVANAQGGRQSKCEYLFTDFCPKALLAVAAVSAQGFEKYGPDNWRKIPAREHVNHALVHIFAHLAGDKQEKHLAHAVCRLLFAMGVGEDET